ncbi:MAG: hypothetical protein JRN67_00950, partial [Nitrososphaerota archaeon]|nr:hypothetical protein [Nitrososphaerota archaeon]
MPSEGALAVTRLAERWHPTQRMTSKVSLIAFVLLCASFLLYPIQYSYAFSQLESLQVIYQPILFSLLYAAWILTGLVTLRRNTGASIQIGIVSLFSVMSGVIVLRMAPLGTDHTYAITYFATSYLNSV